LRRPAARQPDQDRGIGNRIDIFCRQPGLFQRRLNQAVRFYARGRARPVQAPRRRSRRAISPDYTVGWLTDLFIVINRDAGFIAGCFNTQYTHDCFLPRFNTAQCRSMTVDVKLCSPQEGFVYTPHPYKSPFQKGAVLYKAAAVAVKFRTILK
jgi:hypothetical protein